VTQSEKFCVPGFHYARRVWHNLNMDVHIDARGVIGVGYGGKSIDVFVRDLLASGTCVLVDVRLNPISRKSGFSKRALANTLASAGISYWHFPELGNPGWNRAGFAGPPEEVRAARARFASMLGGEAANARIEEIGDAAAHRLVALMCVEADERACHRYVILSELRRRSQATAAAV
jgi:uncharacterized protein (DUF488 family)